jgi:hypothetical protein
MKEMPSLNMSVQRLNVAILPLDLPCSGPITHSGENFNHWQVSQKKARQIFFKQSHGCEVFILLNANLYPIIKIFHAVTN